MMNNTNLKNISIRGRVTFALFLLEQIANKMDIKCLEVIINEVKKFTLSSRLDIWHSNVEKLTSEYILESVYSEMEGVISEADFDNLKRCYSTLPKDIITIIDDTIWIGISNLYGVTGEYAKESLVYLSSVILHSQKYDVKMPILKNKFPFYEEGGWGRIFDYDNEKKAF